MTANLSRDDELISHQFPVPYIHCGWRWHSTCRCQTINECITGYYHIATETNDRISHSTSIDYVRHAILQVALAISDCELFSWWRHQMETFSALLAICAGKSPVTGEFRAQRPVTRIIDVSFHLRLNKRLSKQIVRLVIWDAIAPIMTSV